MKRAIAAISTFAALFAGLTVASSAQRPALAMLDGLDAGDWQMRIRDEPDSPIRLCVANGRDFIQLRHPSQRCKRIVVDDAAAEVTVQYTCPGKGYGRTSIRRESNRLVQIESQGIADGLPFSFSAEARRVGSCRN